MHANVCVNVYVYLCMHICVFIECACVYVAAYVYDIFMYVSVCLQYVCECKFVCFYMRLLNASMCISTASIPVILCISSIWFLS